MKRKQIDGMVFSTWALLVSAAIVFLVSGVFWYRNVYLDETRVFWAAIDNALGTKGVQRSIDLSTDGTTQTQVTDFSFTPRIASETVASYKVPNGQEVVSRAISYSDAEYAVFDSVVNAENPQLAQAEGLWTQTGSGDVISGALADSLTNGTLIFTGNLPKEKRTKLIKLMKDTGLYEIIDTSTTKEYTRGTANVYTVQIDPTAYNIVLASYFQMIGMSRFAEQVSSTTNDAEKARIEIAINPKTRQIYETGYPALRLSGSQMYDLWGYSKPIRAPEGALSTDELQKRLEYTPE